ncbi:hypothetical protein WJX81_000057 [Elliptochloris bilobata]|uniref:Patatin n=1 Tax=Elliptochloris bilobata TaxID=381761 RepID=A0AAW1QHK6_9CHLO
MASGAAKRCSSGARSMSFLCRADGTDGFDFDYLSTLPDSAYDLVLSSGFLAFSSHSGFLKAVEAAGLQVSGVMGTSAGALSGSLYCAGYSPDAVARELSRVAPINLLRPSCRPWRGGAISLHKVTERLRDLLPPSFEDLDTEFAVGVVSKDGDYRLIDSGPLPEAVAASAAIPYIFNPVHIPGQAGGPFKDGGLADRTGLVAWRRRREAQARARAGEALAVGAAPVAPAALVHLIARSSRFSGADDVEATGQRRVTVVRSPRSGVNFFDLGNFEDQMAAAFQRAQPAMRQVRERHSSRRQPSPIRRAS